MINSLKRFAYKAGQMIGNHTRAIAGLFAILGAMVIALSQDDANAADSITISIPISFKTLVDEAISIFGQVVVIIAGLAIVIGLCYMGIRKLSASFNLHDRYDRGTINKLNEPPDD